MGNKSAAAIAKALVSKPKAGTRPMGKVPIMDANTSFAITSKLGKAQREMMECRQNAFYDPRDAETRKAQDVGGGLAILRSWMRLQGLRPYEIFQHWDQEGRLHVSRKDLKEGLALFGLTLETDLLTHVFDHMADGYKLTYDAFKEWFEGTKYDHLSDEEREIRAATFIQACIRGKRSRRAADKRRDSSRANTPAAQNRPT